MHCDALVAANIYYYICISCIVMHYWMPISIIFALWCITGCQYLLYLNWNALLDANLYYYICISFMLMHYWVIRIPSSVVNSLVILIAYNNTGIREHDIFPRLFKSSLGKLILDIFHSQYDSYFDINLWYWLQP